MKVNTLSFPHLQNGRGGGGRVGIYLLIELQGLNEPVHVKHLAVCIGKHSDNISFITCSVTFISKEIIIFNLDNLCQIAF